MSRSIDDILKDADEVTDWRDLYPLWDELVMSRSHLSENHVEYAKEHILGVGERLAGIEIRERLSQKLNEMK